MRVDEIKARYGIDSIELEEIRMELRRILREIHPDNNSGEYDVNYFTKVSADLSFIDNEMKNKNTSEVMVPLDKMMYTLIEATHNANFKIKQMEELQNKLEKSIDNQMIRLRSKFRTPRVGLSTITAVLSFIWLFPDKIISHPVFKKLNGSANLSDNFILTISLIWLFVCYMTGMYWIMTAMHEKKEKELLEKIKLESEQNDLFMEFLNTELNKNIFSKQDFIDYIINVSYYKHDYFRYLSYSLLLRTFNMSVY
ncbi:MAG: hypothetical protein ACRC36_25085, partial [Lacrimispora sphenoides]